MSNGKSFVIFAIFAALGYAVTQEIGGALIAGGFVALIVAIVVDS